MFSRSYIGRNDHSGPDKRHGCNSHNEVRACDPQHSREVAGQPGCRLCTRGASPSHAHAKSAFIYAYVVSSAIESQVNDGPKRVYRAGESFFEEPGSLHRVSRNASKTEPAKLLAVFVVDTNDKALTTPVK